MRLICRHEPFHAIVFKHWHTDDTEVGICVVKGTFRIGSSGTLAYTDEQPDLLFEDVYSGSPASSSLLREQEIAPFKPRTDLTLDAVARSPRSARLADWPVRVEVRGRASHGFQVCGPRLWERNRLGRWVLSAAEPVEEVSLRYELAYGGCIRENGDIVAAHDLNPAGRGFALDRSAFNDQPVPAAQIAELGEIMTASPDESWRVCGFGPVAKSWLPRRALAGTFDEIWHRERHPRMPRDYDYGFWNVAPNALQIAPYLEGGEEILLHGMRHDPAPLRLRLPEAGLALTTRSRDSVGTEPRRMNLDFVHIDARSGNERDLRVVMNWRLPFRDADMVEEVTVEALRLQETS